MLRNFIPIKIDGCDMHVMIDTGVDICVADRTFFKTLMIMNYLNQNVSLLLVNKKTKQKTKKMPITDMIFVRSFIGNQFVMIKLYLVDNLQTKLILGLEFLQKHKVILDFGYNRLSIDPRRNIKLKESLKISPNSEAVIVGKLTGKALPEDRWGQSIPI